MVRPHAYLNGGVTHPVQQAQWPFLTRPALCHCLQGPRTRTRTLEGTNLVGMRNTE